MLSKNVAKTTVTQSKQAIITPIVKENHNNSSIAEDSVHKSRSSSFKRVSFGNASSGTVVQTFVYESVPIVEEEFARSQSPIPPPSKVCVEIVDYPAPSHIQPPVTDISVSSWDSNLTSSVDLHNINGVLTSTPILQHKTHQLMEYDHDNPFRPDGSLSHEVEPIVEVYKHRPYPSPQELDTIAGTLNRPSAGNAAAVAPGSPTKNAGGNKLPSNKNDIKNGLKSSSNPKGEIITKPSDIKLNTTAPDGHVIANNQQADVQHRVLASPKAGTVQVVHVEEKKKPCACCVIQ